MASESLVHFQKIIDCTNKSNISKATLKHVLEPKTSEVSAF
uniref:Uncharacterized protein n=1 Tax=Arundo donax TaxID=35708 RepID=A0A0A8YC76_ARUDO